jgi:hypothetical protein
VEAQPFDPGAGTWSTRKSPEETHAWPENLVDVDGRPARDTRGRTSALASPARCPYNRSYRDSRWTPSS